MFKKIREYFARRKVQKNRKRKAENTFYILWQLAYHLGEHVPNGNGEYTDCIYGKDGLKITAIVKVCLFPGEYPCQTVRIGQNHETEMHIYQIRVAFEEQKVFVFNGSKISYFNDSEWTIKLYEQYCSFKEYSV